MKWGLLVKLLKLRPLGLSAIALMAMASAAQALDAADFAGKVISIYATSMAPGEKVTFGPGTVSGNDITYDGLTLTTPGAGPVALTTGNAREAKPGPIFSAAARTAASAEA